jgi:hypothetical protein
VTTAVALARYDVERLLVERRLTPFVAPARDRARHADDDIGLHAPFRDVEVAGERRYVARAADRKGDL